MSTRYYFADQKPPPKDGTYLSVLSSDGSFTIQVYWCDQDQVWACDGRPLPDAQQQIYAWRESLKNE